MGFFSKILDKLGIKKEAEPTVKPMTTAPAGKPATASKPMPGMAHEQGKDAAASKPVASAAASMSEVDVVKKLNGLADGSGLDWKVSIVDLLKLLDIDSSREARNELAKELGCPDDLMGDSAKMNVWLHKTVLKKIAENGGNIPASLLD